MFPNAATSRAVFLKNNYAAGENTTTAGTRHSTGGTPQAAGGNIPGLDTVPTFAGAFAAQGGPSAGNVFLYIMIGNNPLLGGVTDIPARINGFPQSA